MAWGFSFANHRIKNNKCLVPLHNDRYTNQALQLQPNIDQHLAIGCCSFYSNSTTNVESLTDVVYVDVWPHCVVG